MANRLTAKGSMASVLGGRRSRIAENSADEGDQASRKDDEKVANARARCFAASLATEGGMDHCHRVVQLQHCVVGQTHASLRFQLHLKHCFSHFLCPRIQLKSSLDLLPKTRRDHQNYIQAHTFLLTHKTRIVYIMGKPRVGPQIHGTQE